MPRPGPAKISVSVRMSQAQVDALETHGKYLISQNIVEEDELTGPNGSINTSAVVRTALRRAIVGFPA